MIECTMISYQHAELHVDVIFSGRVGKSPKCAGTVLGPALDKAKSLISYHVSSHDFTV